MLVAILSKFVSPSPYTHTHHSKYKLLLLWPMATKPMVIWHTAMSSGTGSTKDHLVHTVHSTSCTLQTSLPYCGWCQVASVSKHFNYSLAPKVRRGGGGLFACNSIFSSMLQFKLLVDSAPLPEPTSRLSLTNHLRQDSGRLSIYHQQCNCDVGRGRYLLSCEWHQESKRLSWGWVYLVTHNSRKSKVEGNLYYLIQLAENDCHIYQTLSVQLNVHSTHTCQLCHGHMKQKRSGSLQIYSVHMRRVGFSIYCLCQESNLSVSKPMTCTRVHETHFNTPPHDSHVIKETWHPAIKHPVMQ